MKKVLQQIVIENEYLENCVKIEYIASKGDHFPAIPVPNLQGDKKLFLTYVYDGEELVPEEYIDEDVEKKLNELIDDGIIEKLNKEYENPIITYNDITEKILLGSKEISKEYIVSKERGIWSDCGNRKIEIKFSDTECFVGKKITVRINLKTINGIRNVEQNYSTDWYEFSENKVIVKLNTDLLGKAFEGKNEEKKHLLFGGEIEVNCDNGLNRYIKYKYPFEITVMNTNSQICDLVSDKPASIDFGTSSTCVAIEGDEGVELLSLSSGADKDNNIFENPTNIMIFNWKEFYEEWRIENEDMPIPHKGEKRDYIMWEKKQTNVRVDYDFGYSVKKILGEENTSRKELNAILSLIKMIPYQIVQEKQQVEINPLNDKNCYIDIVAHLDEQDESHLDPVAFYGYLIGRAINDLSKHNMIYTKFQITSPVMFNDDIKTLLRESLKYGLERSVPKKLREYVEVSMDHTEPVAYIGAMCGTKYFQIEENEKKYFAVYDFGGGTLDFSYGIAINDEDELRLKILKVGGKENIGGESLIERIAFQVYCSSGTEMLEKGIPIVKPYGEEIPDEIPEEMLKKSEFAKANMNIISASIARKIFKNESLPDKASNFELYDVHGEQKECKLSYDEDDLKGELEKNIKETIDTFKRELEVTFKNEKNFDFNEVYIFKAGNSSRSEFVDKGMREAFPDNKHIQLVDQMMDKSVKNKRYAITPKTAVAFGQLRLNNFIVEGDGVSFKYYLGYFNEGTGQFKVCIDKSDNMMEWHKFRVIRNDIIDVFFASSIPEVKDKSKTARTPLNVQGHKDETLFVRIKNDNTFEYCVCNCKNVEDIPEDILVKEKVLQ